MEENYLLSVIGKQIVEGESDQVDLKTRAAYVTKNGSRYISYTEYDVNNPKQHYRTTVKVSPDNVVTVIEGGNETHSLILEQGVRHKCHYLTSFGSITLGIFTDKVDVNLDDSGGELRVHYNIDFHTELASSNELIINIKEAKHHVDGNPDSQNLERSNP